VLTTPAKGWPDGIGALATQPRLPAVRARGSGPRAPSSTGSLALPARYVRRSPALAPR